MEAKLETRVGLFVLASLAIFIYMGFKIGAFRFDRGRYRLYTMSFNDITGLSKKAEVKIAGVAVGWVEEVGLSINGGMKATAEIMIQRDYILYENAYALVRQDGLLGPKYLEISTGDPLLPPIKEGGALTKPGVEPVSIDELLKQFKKIATNVEDVTNSMRGVLGDVQGEDQLRSIFGNLSDAAERMASFSAVLERSFTRNEDNIDTILSLGNDIRRLAEKLEMDVLPAIQQSVEKVSDVFDRDIGGVASQIGSTVSAIEDASAQARNSFQNLSSIAEKIDSGKGLVGKLINEDETYYDIKVAAQGLRNYFSKVETLEVIFDFHSETMGRMAENYTFEDSKGYFDVRFHPNEDHFYLFQLVTSEKGSIDRYERHTEFCDEDACPVDTSTLELSDQVEHTLRKKVEWYTRNTFKFGAQFGRIYNNIALRLGLFEGSAGAGVDFDIPFNTNKVRWVTSIEAFDFTGWSRKDDRRPHIKWINKMFVFDTIYMTFGADDFVSKRNANAFFGVGFRFGDDDVKYLFSSLGSLGSVSGGESTRCFT